MKSCNPCYNGYSVHPMSITRLTQTVVILVIMDIVYTSKVRRAYSRWVVILVIMDIVYTLHCK